MPYKPRLPKQIIIREKAPKSIRRFLKDEELVDLEKVIDAINEYLKQGHYFDNLWRLFAAYGSDYDIYKDEKRVEWTDAPRWVAEIGQRIEDEERKYYGKIVKEAGYNYILEHCYFDHAFFKNTAYINEPYEMSMEGLKRLLAFCEKHGLYCYIRGESKHFPGRTFRIVITKRG